jgi:iron complex transport system substrate-binding protein
LRRVRIVSLLPSATEIVFALGRGDELVGVTFECDFPVEARSRRVVSTSALPEGLSPAEIDRVVSERIAAGEDLYRLDADALRDLNPDVILTQDLCAVCAVDVARVDDALDYLGCHAEVVTLDPRSVDEVIDSIATVAAVLGASAAGVITDARARLAALAHRLLGVAPRPTLLLEWTDPPFSAGHWTPDLVTLGGGTPLLSHPGGDSQRLSWDDIRAAPAEVVIVAPCGYHLDRSVEIAKVAIAEGSLPVNAQVWAVDADAYFVRPGPRVIGGAEIVAGILHPGDFGEVSAAHAVRVA